MSYLTGVHADDPGQLEILLGQAHALGLMGNVTLAHLPALLVLDDTEHSEGPVLPCTHHLPHHKHQGGRGLTLRQLPRLLSCIGYCVSC